MMPKFEAVSREASKGASGIRQESVLRRNHGDDSLQERDQ